VSHAAGAATAEGNIHGKPIGSNWHSFETAHVPSQPSGKYSLVIKK
jgi:hypothetical protein